MIKKILKASGFYAYARYWRNKHFPSPSQKREMRHSTARIEFYKQFISPGDLCFDIGANIGNRTEVFLNLGARVVAIEPQTECATILRLKFGKKIELLRVALGSTEGSGTIFLSDSTVVSSMSRDWIEAVAKTRFKDKKWNDTEKVAVTTLDALVFKFGIPKFCKIDVEGFEVEVLKGLSRRLCNISFEYAVPEKFNSIQACLERLAKLGKVEYNYTVGENMKLELSNWVESDVLLKEIQNLQPIQSFGDIYVRFI